MRFPKVDFLSLARGRASLRDVLWNTRGLGGGSAQTITQPETAKSQMQDEQHSVNRF
jgi:hypothetical protein